MLAPVSALLWFPNHRLKHVRNNMRENKTREGIIGLIKNQRPSGKTTQIQNRKQNARNAC